MEFLSELSVAPIGAKRSGGVFSLKSRSLDYGRFATSARDDGAWLTAQFEPSWTAPSTVAAGISGFFLILVMMADPVRQVGAGRLVAALRRNIEETADRADVFGPAGKHRI